MATFDPFAGSKVLQTIALKPLERTHIVHFYADEDFFLKELAEYLFDAIGRGESGVVIATDDHLREIAARLTARGADLSAARRDGRYVEADAAATLATFVHNGAIDPVRFADAAGSLIVRGMGANSRPVRAFGEMVALLCADRRFDLAHELEKLWVELSRRVAFALLCAYPTGLFREETSGDDIAAIARLHDRAVHSGHRGDTAPGAVSRSGS